MLGRRLGFGAARVASTTSHELHWAWLTIPQKKDAVIRLLPGAAAQSSASVPGARKRNAE